MRPRNCSKQPEKGEAERTGLLVSWGLKGWPPTHSHDKKTRSDVHERVKPEEESFTIEERVNNESICNREEDCDSGVVQTSGEMIDRTKHATEPMMNNRTNHLDLNRDEERNVKKLVSKLSTFQKSFKRMKGKPEEERQADDMCPNV